MPARMPHVPWPRAPASLASGRRSRGATNSSPTTIACSAISALAADEVDAAARAHGRATLYAYVFQAIPSRWTPTMDFYGEIVGRRRIDARCGSGDLRGRALALALHAFWRPWRTHCGIGDERDELNAALDVGDPGRLAAVLFPPPRRWFAFDFIDQAASYSRAVLIAVVPSVQASSWARSTSSWRRWSDPGGEWERTAQRLLRMRPCIASTPARATPAMPRSDRICVIAAVRR